jgi:hypothetical protein
MEVLEAPGVEPVFPGERSREHAIDYARTRQLILVLPNDLADSVQEGREKNRSRSYKAVTIPP